MNNFCKIRLLFSCLVIFIILCFLIGCELPFSSTEVTNEPKLSLDTTALYFGESLTEKTFSITNAGAGKLDWSVTVSEDAPWCSISQDAGDGYARITVTVNREGLSPGEHTAIITVNSSGGSMGIEIHVVVTSTTGNIIIDGSLPE